MAARGRRLGRRGAGATRARDDTAHLRGAGVDRAARGDRRERSRGVVLRARLPRRWPPGDRVRARPRRPDAAARPRGREPRAAHRSRVATTASARAAPARTPTASSTPAAHPAGECAACWRRWWRTVRRPDILASWRPAHRLEPPAARRRGDAGDDQALRWRRALRDPRRRDRDVARCQPAPRRGRAGARSRRRPCGARHLRCGRAGDRTQRPRRRRDGDTRRSAARAQGFRHGRACRASTALARRPAVRRSARGMRLAGRVLRAGDAGGRARRLQLLHVSGRLGGPRQHRVGTGGRERHEPVAPRFAVRQRRDRRPDRSRGLVRRARRRLGMACAARSRPARPSRRRPAVRREAPDGARTPGRAGRRRWQPGAEPAQRLLPRGRRSRRRARAHELPSRLDRVRSRRAAADRNDRSAARGDAAVRPHAAGILRRRRPADRRRDPHQLAGARRARSGDHRECRGGGAASVRRGGGLCRRHRVGGARRPACGGGARRAPLA